MVVSEKLIAAEAVEKLFAQFDAMLSAAGFTASGGQIIDATFVEVPRQRNSRDDNETIKKGEVPADWNDKKKRTRTPMRAGRRRTRQPFTATRTTSTSTANTS